MSARTELIQFFVIVINCYIPNSSSSTILAYGSHTLFLSNRGSDVVYTISSDLRSIGSGQTLAVGRIEFDGSQPQEIRDIVISSRSLQPLPGVCICVYVFVV